MAESTPFDDPAPSSLPPMPAVASDVVDAERLPVLERYAQFLAVEGTVRGLIGPREVPRLWDRHVLNCAVLSAELPHGAQIADIGSGAGLPGLVLAIVRPDLEVTLIEPLLRRTTFLTEAVVELGLANVEVVRGRADALHRVRTFDVVTSRAVAPLDRLLEWSMPLVRPEGALVAMKGSSVREEIEAARGVLDRFGCAEPTVSELGAGVLEARTIALRVSWADPSRVSLPAMGKKSSPQARGDRRPARQAGAGTAGRRRPAAGSGPSKRAGGR